jgi:hypothetical protein
MKVALVCIAKNEDFYIKEWVEYHKKIGFDTIFIFQNDWDCQLDDNDIVKITFDGECKQIISYNHFIQNYHKEYQWGAFFDVDEFLVLKKHNNIKDFLSEYNNFDSIGINWVFFGDNGNETINGDYSLIRRFTKRQKNVDPHIKTILKLSPNVNMNIHNPTGVWYDVKGNKHSGAFNYNGNIDVVQLNHYYVKTKEEFKIKMDKGRADMFKSNPDWGRKWELFDIFNLNEVEDLTAYNFFYNDNNNILNT